MHHIAIILCQLRAVKLQPVHQIIQFKNAFPWSDNKAASGTIRCAIHCNTIREIKWKVCEICIYSIWLKSTVFVAFALILWAPFNLVETHAGSIQTAICLQCSGMCWSLQSFENVILYSKCYRRKVIDSLKEQPAVHTTYNKHRWIHSAIKRQIKIIYISNRRMNLQKLYFQTTSL